jgi:hypothetical protein
MKKLINLALELTIIAGIMFTIVLFVWGMKTSDRDLVIISMLTAVFTVVIHTVYSRLSLYNQIKRDNLQNKMRVHGRYIDGTHIR